MGGQASQAKHDRAGTDGQQMAPSGWAREGQRIVGATADKKRVMLFARLRSAICKATLLPALLSEIFD